MAKKPQTARGISLRASRARRAIERKTVLCPTHGTQIAAGLAGGWHRFRCGCETHTPATQTVMSA